MELLRAAFALRFAVYNLSLLATVAFLVLSFHAAV